jgi:hypothetical protein
LSDRPRFSSFRKALIIVSDPQHRNFSLRVAYLGRKRAGFFRVGTNGRDR